MAPMKAFGKVQKSVILLAVLKVCEMVGEKVALMGFWMAASWDVELVALKVALMGDESVDEKVALMDVL
jgi:hypothetical protein